VSAAPLKNPVSPWTRVHVLRTSPNGEPGSRHGFSCESRRADVLTLPQHGYANVARVSLPESARTVTKPNLLGAVAARIF
jgi:hypothetical protein